MVVRKLLVRGVGRRTGHVRVPSESLVHVRVLQVSCRVLVFPLLRRHFQISLGERVQVRRAVIVKWSIHTFLELQISVRLSFSFQGRVLIERSLDLLLWLLEPNVGVAVEGDGSTGVIEHNSLLLDSVSSTHDVLLSKLVGTTQAQLLMDLPLLS